MGSHSLLQGIVPTQELNLGLLHCRWILYHLSHQGNLWVQSLLRELRSYKLHRASLVTQVVKKLHATQKTWVQFLGQEDPLEKEMETHSSILAWKIP